MLRSGFRVLPGSGRFIRPHASIKADSFFAGLAVRAADLTASIAFPSTIRALRSHAQPIAPESKY